MSGLVGQSQFKRIKILGFPLSGMFCLSMFRISIGVLIPEVAWEFSLREVEVGLILSAYLGAMALVMALGGYASDRMGRKTTMGAGVAVMALGILLGGFSESFSILVASIFMAGVGAGVYTPSLYAHIGEVLPGSRGFLAGITNSIYAFGGFLGPLIFGLLARGYGWRTPLIVFAVLSLASSVAIFTVPYSRSQGTRSTGTSYRIVLKSRGVVLIATALAIVNVGFVSFTAWTPKFLIDLEGFTVGDAGLAFGLYSLFGGIGSIVLGWFSDRFGRRRITASTSILAALLAMIYYLDGDISGGYSIVTPMVFSAALGFVSFAYWNLSIAAAQDLVDPSVFGSVTGFIQNMALISAAVAPIISGGLIGLIGMPSALIVSVSIPYLAHGLIFALYGLRTKL